MITFSASKETSFSADIGQGGVKRKVMMHIDKEKPIFIINMVRYPGDAYRSKYDLSKIQKLTNQLIDTKGGYLTLHGPESPFELLSWMSEKNFIFAKEKGRRAKLQPSNDGSFIDISGNIEQYSRAFHYRFFCQEVLDTWLTAAHKTDLSLKLKSVYLHRYISAMP